MGSVLYGGTLRVERPDGKSLMHRGRTLAGAAAGREANVYGTAKLSIAALWNLDGIARLEAVKCIGQSR